MCYRIANCPICKRVFCVNAKGKIWKHRGRRIGQFWCAGSGRKVMKDESKEAE